MYMNFLTCQQQHLQQQQYLLSFCPVRNLVYKMYFRKHNAIVEMFYTCIIYYFLTEAPPAMNCTDECRHVNVQFNGTCPKPGSCSWRCAAVRFQLQHEKCEGGRVYHCARNYTDKNLIDPTLSQGFKYIEACAHAIPCPKGRRLNGCIFFNLTPLQFA